MDQLRDDLTVLLPYFEKNGKLDLSKTDPTPVISDILTRLIEVRIDQADSGFAADAVLAQQVLIQDGQLMKFWGKVIWLGVPGGYEINRSGYDPFYAEFRRSGERILIEEMYVGDHDKLNLNKYDWVNMNLNWKYRL